MEHDDSPHNPNRLRVVARPVGVAPNRHDVASVNHAIELSSGAGDVDGEWDDLGTVPDVRLKPEMLIYQSTTRAAVIVDLPTMDRRLADAIARQVDAGLSGRGFATISGNGRLFVDFGMTSSEADRGTLLNRYCSALLAHLGLPSNALLVSSVDHVQLESELLEPGKALAMSLGLRAVTQSTSS